MVVDPAQPRMSYQDFLAFERASTDTRHELIEGIVYALSGGSLAHARISSNVLRALEDALGDRGPCQAYSSDVKVRVFDGPKAAPGTCVYPDATVTCDVIDAPGTEHDVIESPRVVVEVLSPSNESLDRGIKAVKYRLCSSIQEIVYIRQDYPFIEVQHRQTENLWSQTIYDDLDAVVHLESIDVEIAVRDIYRSIRFGR